MGVPASGGTTVPLSGVPASVMGVPASGGTTVPLSWSPPSGGTTVPLSGEPASVLSSGQAAMKGMAHIIGMQSSNRRKKELHLVMGPPEIFYEHRISLGTLA
jgi:hypothetical protein